MNIAWASHLNSPFPCIARLCYRFIVIYHYLPFLIPKVTSTAKPKDSFSNPEITGRINSIRLNTMNIECNANCEYSWKQKRLTALILFEKKILPTRKCATAMELNELDKTWNWKWIQSHIVSETPSPFLPSFTFHLSRFSASFYFLSTDLTKFFQPSFTAQSIFPLSLSLSLCSPLLNLEVCNSPLQVFEEFQRFRCAWNCMLIIWHDGGIMRLGLNATRQRRRNINRRLLITGRLQNCGRFLLTEP